MNAISGFTCSVVIVLFGATVGTLVDRYQRLSGKPWVKMHLNRSCSLFFSLIEVARVSLAVQNVSVALSCMIVVCIMVFNDQITLIWTGYLIYFLQGYKSNFNIQR
jgi:hypothetical protein